MTTRRLLIAGHEPDLLALMVRRCTRKGLQPGTTTVYLSISLTAARTLTLTLRAGSAGSGWTDVGTTSWDVGPTGGVIQLLSSSFSKASCTFGAGELLPFDVGSSAGSFPNGIYWDGMYSGSRVVVPRGLPNEDGQRSGVRIGGGSCSD